MVKHDQSQSLSLSPSPFLPVKRWKTNNKKLSSLLRRKVLKGSNDARDDQNSNIEVYMMLRRRKEVLEKRNLSWVDKGNSVMVVEAI